MIAEYSNANNKLLNIMKKNAKDYLTPECVTVECAPEGVLCASEGGNGWTINDYGYEKVDSWD